MEVDFSKERILYYILPYVAGRYVLDVGCVEHSMRQMNRDRSWLHGFLVEHAEQVVGIDILEEEVEQMRTMGYDVYCQNAEDFQFEEQFDVIIAGELIEHLSSIGVFLDRCRKHLRRGGRLILTTPNAFSLGRTLGNLVRHTNDPPVNSQHTCWFSPGVLRQLALRYGFEIDCMRFVDYPYRTKRPMKTAISSLLCTVFGDKFRETIFAVFSFADA